MIDGAMQAVYTKLWGLQDLSTKYMLVIGALSLVATRDQIITCTISKFAKNIILRVYRSEKVNFWGESKKKVHYTGASNLYVLGKFGSAFGKFSFLGMQTPI